MHLAFDLSENNCTLVRSEAYVVFVANVIRSLTPGSFEPEKYQCRSPLQTGLNPAWKRIAGDESFDEPTLSAAGLTSPGVYRDAGGKLHAVSLLGLKSSRAAMRPEKAIGEIELPAPRISGQPMELWSILLVAAGLLWLAGWCVGALKD